MSQIDEFQARIMEALDRIGRSIEARADDVTGASGADASDDAAIGARVDAAEQARAKADARAEAAEAARAEADARAKAAEEARAEADARAKAAEEAGAEAAAALALAQSAALEAEAQESDELQKLREALEEEKLANAQLQERVKVLHARLDASQPKAGGTGEAEAAGTDEAAEAEALRRLDADLQSLRKANEQLRESNAALREAAETGISDPHLVNDAMMAELEGLRATRAADRGEVAVVLAEIDRAIATARDAERTEEA